MPSRKATAPISRATKRWLGGRGRATRTRSLVWFTGICPWCWGWPPVIAGRGWNRRTWPRGLLGLLSAVGTYRPDGTASFATYASVCVRHRIISAVKRAGSLRNVPPSAMESWDDGDFEGLPNGQADPERMLLEREEAARMRERLKAVLTELEYQVLMLYLSAYSYEEIAARLHVGAKTVDNALQRVRRKLDASIWREFSQDY